MKKILFVVFLALLLVGCGVPEANHSAALAEIQNLQNQLENTQNELDASIAEVEQIATNLEMAKVEYTEEIDAMNSEIEKLKEIETEYFVILDEKENAQAEFDALTESYDELNSKFRIALADRSKAESELAVHRCDVQIDDMQYDGILDISTILMGWLARRNYVDMVHNSYRDTIWNNTDTKIHSIRYRHTDGKSYVDHFLVYFDEFGWTEGVFWLSEQCWLADGP